MITNSPEPFHLLTKYLPRINKGLALDIGAGGGGNSIFLVANGFKVEAIDINTGAIKQLSDLAFVNNLDIQTRVMDMREFELDTEKYDLILAIQSLVFLGKSEFRKMISSIETSLKESSVVIVSSLTYCGFTGTIPYLREKWVLRLNRNVPF